MYNYRNVFLNNIKYIVSEGTIMFEFPLQLKTLCWPIDGFTVFNFAL